MVLASTEREEKRCECSCHMQRAVRGRRAQFCSLCSQEGLQGAWGSQQSLSGKLISRREVPWNNVSITTAPPLLGCALWKPQSLKVRAWEGTKAGSGRGRVLLQSWVTVPVPRAERVPFPVLYNKWLLVAVPASGDTILWILILSTSKILVKSGSQVHL